MRSLLIVGQSKVEGTIYLHGAKNSAVALLPAALLCDETVYLQDIPMIRDVEVISSLFRHLGVKWRRQGEGWTIFPQAMTGMNEIPASYAGQYRASYYFIGALLARYKRLFISLPGGDDFGGRPIDQHLKGFRAMGVRIEAFRDGLLFTTDRLKGAKITFDVITSGATINMILAAVKAEGETILQNAARDPEVVDLANFLAKMGAKIYGAGTDRIRIIGVKHLGGAEHRPIPDRLLAGAFLIAALATDGAIEIRNVIPEHLSPLTAKLREMNARFSIGEDRIHAEGKQNLRAVRVRTGMYPAFPTDLQQPLTSLLLKAHGRSIVTETVYPGRFAHVPELIKMGADIKRRGATTLIRGGVNLVGQTVRANDVRAGLSLLIAGMMAEGKTRLLGIEHLERGVAALLPTLHQLSIPAKIEMGWDRGTGLPSAEEA